MTATFTREEIAKHNTAEDCWVILNGKVLDLSTANFTDHHPGKTAYIKGAGQDVTEMMSTIHKGSGHSKNAYEWAEKFVIGTVESQITNAG